MVTLDIKFPGGAVEALGPLHVARLQRFLERCPDFSAVAIMRAIDCAAATTKTVWRAT